jgi:hypothetical protein
MFEDIVYASAMAQDSFFADNPGLSHLFIYNGNDIVAYRRPPWIQDDWGGCAFIYSSPQKTFMYAPYNEPPMPPSAGML